MLSCSHLIESWIIMTCGSPSTALFSFPLPLFKMTTWERALCSAQLSSDLSGVTLGNWVFYGAGVAWSTIPESPSWLATLRQILFHSSLLDQRVVSRGLKNKTIIKVSPLSWLIHHLHTTWEVGCSPQPEILWVHAQTPAHFSSPVSKESWTPVHSLDSNTWTMLRTTACHAPATGCSRS